MEDSIGSFPLIIDPTSLLLSHCSDPLNPNKALQLITDSYIMERGPRYIAYAQLRESKLRFKRLKCEEDEQVPEIPTSEFSPVKKTVRFQENFLGDIKKQGYVIEEDEQVPEIPRSEFSPVKKSVTFQGNGKKQGYSDDQISEIPRSEFSPMKKAVRFQGNSKIQGYADDQVSEIPRSEFSPMKKAVKFQGNSKKQGYPDDQVSEIPRSEFSPMKKSMRFQSSSKKQGNSVLAQSVPDFSSAIRKENKKPSENRIPRIEKSATPPPSLSKRDKMYGSSSKLGVGGSKSVNSGEKQNGGKSMMMGRKSYASIDELKGLSIAASTAINGESRGTKKGGNVLRKSTVFSTRYY